MKKYEGKSVRNEVTQYGKLPDNVGFDGRGGGYVRKLTVGELRAQERNLKMMRVKNTRP